MSFLIGKDGKIVHITDNRDAQVHMDELKQSLAATKPWASLCLETASIHSLNSKVRQGSTDIRSRM